VFGPTLEEQVDPVAKCDRLAALYGVEPRALVQAVKRNRTRFPDDFMFQLAPDEWRILKSQSSIARDNDALKHRSRGLAEAVLQGIRTDVYGISAPIAP